MHDPAVLTPDEQRAITEANTSGRPAVVFVHGLWVLPRSWLPWQRLFEANGYATLAPSWPGDPATVEEARRHPEAFVGNGIGSVTAHLAEVIRRLHRPPAIVGHSFGGLITQKLAGMGLGAVSVPIAPAHVKGVAPLPYSVLKGAAPVLANPANWSRAVLLTYPQFKYSWANRLSEREARRLYEEHHVPAPGKPLFQAALARFAPRSEAWADTTTPDRGPMLILYGDRDHLVPTKVAEGAYALQRHNRAPTELRALRDRGHALTIDHGWEEVAREALAFVHAHLPTPAAVR